MDTHSNVVTQQKQTSKQSIKCYYEAIKEGIQYIAEDCTEYVLQDIIYSSWEKSRHFLTHPTANHN